jgi:hypothetical protein
MLLNRDGRGNQRESKKMKSEYQQRKAEGKCVRPRCDRKPKLGPDGKPRSYCTYHNEINKVNTAKSQARKKKGEKP